MSIVSFIIRSVSFQERGSVWTLQKKDEPLVPTRIEFPPPLTSAWFWHRLQSLTWRRYLNSNVTGVATKINLLMYVAYEQRSYAAAQVTSVCNYLQFFPPKYYTHVICRHCDINGGRYTRHHLPKKTVTPLNSTNSCQQMAFIAIPPVSQLPREISFTNGFAALPQQTLSWAPESITLHGDRH